MRRQENTKLDKAPKATDRRGWAPLKQLRNFRENPRQRTQIVLTLACGAVAVCTMLTMLLIDIRAYSALPLLDYWDFWRSIVANGYHLKTLFALHNEHRILLPRLWFMMDHLWFGASGIFVLTSIYLIQFGHGLLLWRIGARASGCGPLENLAMGLLVIAVLFASRQLMNFTQPFQIQFVGVYLLATSALYALMRFDGPTASPPAPKRAYGWLAFSLLLAWAATYTMANGLLLWPVLVVFAVALHLRWKPVALIGANGAVATIFYFQSWISPPQHVSPLASLFNPPQALAFALTYLGSPIDDTVSAISKIFLVGGENYRWLCAAAVGLFGLTAVIVFIARLLERRYAFNRAQLLLVHNLLFIVITAIVTGMARGIQFSLGEALSSRYSTPPLIFWSCFFLLLWSIQTGLGEPEFVQPSTNFQVGALLAIFLLVTINQTPRLATVRAERLSISQVEAAITVPVFDEPVWKRAYFAPQYILQVVEYLHQQRLSVFRSEWTQWPGKSLRNTFRVGSSNDACLGAIDEAAFLPSDTWPGFRVTGWAWDRESRQGPSKVILVNEGGVIVGVALGEFDRPDVVKAQLGVSRPDVGWQGYARSDGFQELDAYLVRERESTVCTVGSIQVKR